MSTYKYFVRLSCACIFNSGVKIVDNFSFGIELIEICLFSNSLLGCVCTVYICIDCFVDKCCFNSITILVKIFNNYPV